MKRNRDESGVFASILRDTETARTSVWRAIEAGDYAAALAAAESAERLWHDLAQLARGAYRRDNESAR